LHQLDERLLLHVSGIPRDCNLACYHLREREEPKVVVEDL